MYVMIIAEARVLIGMLRLELIRIFSSSFFTSLGSHTATPCSPKPVYFARFSSKNFLLLFLVLGFFSAFVVSSVLGFSFLSFGG